MGKIKKILENELVGGTQSTDVYPVTSTKAVYDTNNKVLDDYIQHLKKTSTFAGIATPTTNPGTPDGPVFYIAGEGTYANFSNIVIEAGQLGILKWNGTWSKEVLEIGAGGGSGVSLRTLLTKLNNENPFPTDNGQVLTYNGSNFVWKTPTGGSGGSTSTSVSWQDITNKPSTFTPSSHTHSTNDINGLSNYVQGVKVNNAANADRLLNSRTIWGQSFNGTSDINGHLYMGTAGGGSIQLYMNNGNMLDRTNNTLHIGFGLKTSSDGWIYLDAYATSVYTDNMTKHYDFKSNVFDVNSNQIHFGSETNGGKIYWDAANNAFKIEGNVYATGGITALGVSNSATTSNNVDFTFRSVTANTFNVNNSIQLSDGLKLERNAGDFDLVSTDGNVNSFYFDGNAENYYLNTNGEAFFSNLDCETLSFTGVKNFKIVDANDVSFAIQFTYNNKTYKFTPSSDSITVS